MNTPITFMSKAISIKEQQRIIRSVSQGDYLINLATVLKCASEHSRSAADKQLLETVSGELEYVNHHFMLI